VSQDAPANSCPRCGRWQSGMPTDKPGLFQGQMWRPRWWRAIVARSQQHHSSQDFATWYNAKVEKCRDTHVGKQLWKKWTLDKPAAMGDGCGRSLSSNWPRSWTG